MRYWHTPLLPDADFVAAAYRDHAFAPHWHDAYAAPVIEASAERYLIARSRRARPSRGTGPASSSRAHRR
ncbi:FIG001767: L-rhamnose operon transcriptional activator RhaR [Burkholderia singularis]|uniref:FIG001767: L-rhamnose operon transcriptional activator RhaR n=1 Tax=Burkholderia singularis TaxID=1503053 RepID=A0A238HDE6_9BURK|nr:FIG001767: L-rhamnose operon transcriptional activator RhaR [Burkholderia singularis]